MAKLESALVDRVSQILEDAGNTFFADTTVIQPQLQDSLSIVSAIFPRIVLHQKMAISASKLGKNLTRTHCGRDIDLSDVDFFSIDRVEYPIGHSEPILRSFDLYGKTLHIEIPRPHAGTQSDTRGVKQVLTGTVTFASGSPAVTGSGTAFTSELEVGSYIRKSGSDNWYRVAAIASDTGLTLSINCDSDDDGADTVSLTEYWYEYVNVFTREEHYLEATQTDLAGAVNAGVATGYAEGVRSIAVDALGTGVMPKGMNFTIAGTEGFYRITEDATITTLAATIKFTPRLKGRATENAIVTFYPSSLTPQLEEFLVEVTAAKVVINNQGTARTALANSVTATGLASDAIDKITSVTELINTQADSMVTAATANLSNATGALGKAETSLNTDADALLTQLSADIGLTNGLGADGANLLAATTGIISLANAEVDKAIANVSENNALLDGNLTEIVAQIAAIKAQLTLGIADVARARTFSNAVPRYGSPVSDNLNTANLELNNATAKSNEMLANIEEGRLYGAEVPQNLNTAKGFLSEAQARASVEAQLTQEDALAIRENINLAYGSIAEARGYLDADARNVANLGQAISGYARELQGDVNQASGYFQEASLSLRTAQLNVQMTRWGYDKLNEVTNRMRRSVGVRVSRATI